ncbi:MAG: site-specific DNA-methyltransferase [Verrucomicrobiota bacterium]|jgi:adenine-specific DNA-methyltransferase
MATGIPRTKWQSTTHRVHTNGLNSGNTDVYLSYEGKKSEQEILGTPPAKCRQLWPEHNRRATPNRLYYGDNLPILATLLRDPAVRGHVRLVYIDPPYATKSVFQSRSQADAYTDLLEGAHYLEFLRERLILLRELLADDGSIYIHLDENMAFLVKAVMDEVFGRANFRNWITRKKCNPKNYTRKTYGNIADYILFYTKTDNYIWHRPVDPWTDERAAKEYQYAEPSTGRRYKKVPVHAPGVRNGETGKPWRGVSPPPGKHWQYPPRVLDEMDARGEIYWSPTGNPRRKIYFDQSEGVPVQDIWLEYRDAHNQNIEVSGYPTEKNPAMLTRIIEASSNPGDIVLDCFSGSGTTLSVASHKGRRWIGMDNSPEAISTTMRRFGKGLEPMGDFVSKLGLAEPDQESETTLSLFGPEETAKPTPKQKNSHQTIADFALIAQEPYEGDLADVLEQWMEWNGESKVPQFSEDPVPYRTGNSQKSKRSSKSRKPRR